MIEERFIRRLNVNGESRRQEYLNLGTALEYKQSENCNTMGGRALAGSKDDVTDGC